eukprot:scaffold468544_cov53-Prasinocladus_malaysianus.AAC.1
MILLCTSPTPDKLRLDFAVLYVSVVGKHHLIVPSIPSGRTKVTAMASFLPGLTGRPMILAEAPLCVMQTDYDITPPL